MYFHCEPPVYLFIMVSTNCTPTRDVYTIFKDFGLPIAVLTWSVLWSVLSFYRLNRRKLSIRQVGSSITDKVSRHESVTEFRIEMVITNDSPHATIAIAYYDLALPWNEPQLRPLDDPRELVPPGDLYNEYHSGTKTHRDYVLNHRRYQYGTLAPGDVIRGFFLATGIEPIPVDLLSAREPMRHFDARFVIQDTTGKNYRKPVVLFY
jgi:hypothetical protein